MTGSRLGVIPDASGGRWSLAVAVALLTLTAPAARADDEPEKHPDVHPWKIKRWKGDYFYGNNNRPHTFERAGYPNEVSKFAYPSETCNYAGYYVGGGCTFSGGAPGPMDGTYGWDYVSVGRFDYRVRESSTASVSLGALERRGQKAVVTGRAELRAFF